MSRHTVTTCDLCNRQFTGSTYDSEPVYVVSTAIKFAPTFAQGDSDETPDLCIACRRVLMTTIRDLANHTTRIGATA